MPQLHLPIFPAEYTPINDEIGFERKDGKVVYVYGYSPICQHAEEDLKAFRLYTSQFIDTGTVRAVEGCAGVQSAAGDCQAVRGHLSKRGWERLLCAGEKAIGVGHRGGNRREGTSASGRRQSGSGSGAGSGSAGEHVTESDSVGSASRR